MNNRKKDLICNSLNPGSVFRQAWKNPLPVRLRYMRWGIIPCGACKNPAMALMME
jgi:hypothetical protein